MKLNGKDCLRKCQFPLLLALGTIPIAPIFYAYSEVRFLWIGWALPVTYLLLSWLGLFIPGKGRFVYGMVLFGAYLALGCLLMTHRFNFLLLIPAVFYGLLLLWTLRIAGWSWEEELPVVLFWICVLIHVIAQFFLFTLRVRGDTYVDVAEAVILISFFVFILLALLSMNRDSMAVATAGKFRASASMRMKNVLLTLVIFGVALGIFLIPTVVSAIEQLCWWTFTTILTLVNMITRLMIPLEVTEEAKSSVSHVESLPVSNTEPSLFFEILEFFLIVLLCVLAVVMILALAVFLIKKVIYLVHALWESVNRYASVVAVDYEDTVTDTRDGGEKESLLSSLLGPRSPRVDERKLEPGERIRYRYRRMLLKHPEWGRSSTARENLPPDAAPIYERARYSEHPVTQEDADQFAGRIHRVR